MGRGVLRASRWAIYLRTRGSSACPSPSNRCWARRCCGCAQSQAPAKWHHRQHPAILIGDIPIVPGARMSQQIQLGWPVSLVEWLVSGLYRNYRHQEYHEMCSVARHSIIHDGEVAGNQSIELTSRMISEWLVVPFQGFPTRRTNRILASPDYDTSVFPTFWIPWIFSILYPLPSVLVPLKLSSSVICIFGFICNFIITIVATYFV